VVTASADPAVAPGDVVLSADGRTATDQLADDESIASGSPQFRRVRARVQFGAGPIGSVLTLRLRHSGVEQAVTVARGDKAIQEFSHPAIEQLSDGTYYVDLVRASMADIDAVMKNLASAPAVVFDVRGHPNGNHRVLSHLLTRPDDSKTWIAIPHVIRPDHRPTSVSGWDTEGWELPVLEPHIAGRIAFLVNPETASYGESVMGLVEHYHLGAIVGSATAGANGNIAQIAEPTGCSSVFTGLRVTKSDGSRFHLIGIKPTVPASRTIAGVAAGRDEVLEKALAYLREGNK
jgi:C-terminal processing protease CtpA/Prc